MYLPLSRRWSKAVALVIMGLGFFLSTPPGLITPDDFLNVGLTMMLHTWFPCVPMLYLVLATYTVIAWSLIIIGAMIYPYNTHRLLIGKFNLIRRLMIKTVTDPRYTLIAVIFAYIAYIMLTEYAKYLGGSFTWL